MSFIFFIKMKTFTKRDLVLKLFDININQTVPFLIDKLVDYICEEVFFNKSDLDSEHLNSLKDSLRRIINKTQEDYKKYQRKKYRLFKAKTDWLDSQFDLPDDFKSPKSSKKRGSSDKSFDEFSHTQ